MFKIHTIDFSKRATAFSSLILKLPFFLFDCSFENISWNFSSSHRNRRLCGSDTKSKNNSKILNFLVIHFEFSFRRRVLRPSSCWGRARQRSFRSYSSWEASAWSRRRTPRRRSTRRRCCRRWRRTTRQSRTPPRGSSPASAPWTTILSVTEVSTAEKVLL